MEEDLKSALDFALQKYPERVEMIPLRELVTESARQNGKRAAYAKLSLPDEVVKNLRGPQREDGDLVLLVVVPREVRKRQESLIILPGEIR